MLESNGNIEFVAIHQEAWLQGRLLVFLLWLANLSFPTYQGFRVFKPMFWRIVCRMPDEITLYESKWLGLYRRGHWDYARRPNADACVGILAITDDREILLVEQFRIPVGGKVLEVPAGLVGDEPEFRGESLAQSAARELLEETGYRAGKIELLLSSPTSSGMTPEITHLFHATELKQENPGGGTDSEDITVHKIPLVGLRKYFSEKESEGMLIDFKIHAALAAANLRF
jgi:ADP-ribose pyrophosphatase